MASVNLQSSASADGYEPLLAKSVYARGGSTRSKYIAIFSVALNIVLAIALCWTTYKLQKTCSNCWCNVDEEGGPYDRNGYAIEQVLYDKCTKIENTRLSGDWFEDQNFTRNHGNLTMTSETTAVVVIDMQPIFFANGSPWGNNEALSSSLLPAIKNVLSSFFLFADNPKQAVFTQFITSAVPNEGTGSWSYYYAEDNEAKVTISELVKNGLDPEFLLSVMPELNQWSNQSSVVNKTTAGAFASPQFNKLWDTDLNATQTMVFLGVESDFCVAATVLSALDAGYFVVIVSDGVGSSQPNSGQASLDYLFRRFDHQLRFVTSDELVDYFDSQTA